MTRMEGNEIIINSSNEMRTSWTDLEYSKERDQYYISHQLNQQLAPRTYLKISKERANIYINIAKEDTNKAVEAMDRYLFAEVRDEDRESYIKFWSKYFPNLKGDEKK